jgi:hypothetical protein
VDKTSPTVMNIIANDIASALKLDVKWIDVEWKSPKKEELKIFLHDQTCAEFLIENLETTKFDVQEFDVTSEGKKFHPVMLGIANLMEQIEDERSILRRGVLTSKLNPIIFNFVSPPSVINKCATRTCSDNGECNLADGTCKCFSGFLGDNCATVDLCYDKNCHNGYCVKGECQCSNGWSGSSCNIRDECVNNCHPNGICEQKKCRCQGGWSGQNCQVAPNACFNKYCGGNTRGVCYGGQCFCFDGYSGVDCLIEVNLCPTGKCHKGTCDPKNGLCTCAEGFSGPTCLQLKPTCLDGQKNGNELGVDCGGDCVNPCPSCENNKQDRDESGVDCGGLCLPCRTCGDGIKNGEETDVDCGGSCAPCNALAKCDDGTKNGDEEGIDCGGRTCQKCSLYDWNVGEWSECTAKCGEGFRTRTVTCKNSDTKSTVSSDKCSHLHPVASFQSCNQKACETYHWDSMEFSSCNAACGTGIKIRDISCVGSIHEIVPNLFCELHAENKPSEKQPCNTEACLQGSYNWYLHPLWGDCTEKCIGGIQEREVTCVDDQRISVTLDHCSNVPANVAPKTSRPCTNTQGCDVVYEWFKCPFDECTATCGGGVDGGKIGGSMMGEKRRKIMCMGNGKVVDESYCNEAERQGITEIEVGCNPQACDQYNWMTTPWSDCMLTNDGKLRRRTTHCHAPNGGNAPIADCEKHVPHLKPKLTENCYIDGCPRKTLAPDVTIISSGQTLSPIFTSIMIFCAVPFKWLCQRIAF